MTHRSSIARRVMPWTCSAVPSLPLLLLAALLVGGCASSKPNLSSDLDRQIRLQNAQESMLADPEPEPAKSAKEYEERGDRYMLSHDINRAYIQYVKGLAIEPDNNSLMHKQAALLLGRKRFKDAKAIYDKLVAKDSKDAAALEGCGKAAFGQGLFAEAEKLFHQALSVDNKLWQSCAFLGLIHSGRGEYPQAIERYQQALTLKPGDAGIINNIAVSRYLLGDFKETVRLLEDLAKTTNDRRIYNNLALAYFQLGRYAEALEAFKRGADKEAVAYNIIGYEYLNRKKYREAVKAFEKAIALFPKYYPAAEHNLELAKNGLAGVRLKEDSFTDGPDAAP